jgi:hypothetical protein
VCSNSGVCLKLRSSSNGVLYGTCILCDVVLTVDNSSEVKNLCYECWHGLTR